LVGEAGGYFGGLQVGDRCFVEAHFYDALGVHADLSFVERSHSHRDFDRSHFFLSLFYLKNLFLNGSELILCT